MIRRALPVLFAAFAFVASTQSITLAATAPTPDSPKLAAARMAVRDLWVEHVFWVRNYVMANEAKNTKARDVAAQQVVANAKQLAGAFEPFYGKPASDQLLTLLAGHWGAIKSLEDATAASNAAARTAALDAATANAKEIAKFISTANPHLTYDAVFGLLAAHAAHHMAQIDQVHAGQYEQEAQTWAAMRGHMLMIADALVDGLAAQFPQKF